MGVRAGRTAWADGGGAAGWSGWLGVGHEGKEGEGVEGGATLLRIATSAGFPLPMVIFGLWEAPAGAVYWAIVR